MTLHPLRRYLLFPDQHCYLTCADDCYFAEPYQCNHRKGIRSAILALKRSNTFAITYFAEQLAAAVPREWATGYTFVPMPRSSGRSNALRSVLQKMAVRDCRELVLQRGRTPPSHRGWRPSPAARAELFCINSNVAEPRPHTVVIFDDVVTTGSHFRAAKLVLRERWPELNVVGLFLARVCSWKERCYLRGLQALPPSCLMAAEGPLFT